LLLSCPDFATPLTLLHLRSSGTFTASPWGQVVHWG